jgi:hypothetical protein
MICLYMICPKYDVCILYRSTRLTWQPSSEWIWHIFEYIQKDILRNIDADSFIFCLRCSSIRFKDQPSRVYEEEDIDDDDEEEEEEVHRSALKLKFTVYIVYMYCTYISIFIYFHSCMYVMYTYS